MTNLKLFGTDGIRGTPGEYPLTEEMIARIAAAVAGRITRHPKGIPSIAIGKDTRLSGDSIEDTLVRSITGAGVNAVLVGTITTPGLSYLTKALGCDAGIMISASHNKPTDNGIKFFNAGGHKFSPSDEAEIEKIVFSPVQPRKVNRTQAVRLGEVKRLDDAQERYVKFLQSTVPGLDLAGIKIALDCAWGAAAPFAKRLFCELGADVEAIHDKPSGHSINDGGAVKPDVLKNLVRKTSAHIGVAVDGDGDRGILVNEKGDVLDGDCTMAIIARHLLKNDKLPKKKIVATVMSNLGLKAAIEEYGGSMVVTGVGDKHVLQALLEHGLSVGGEQSGHVIFFDYLSTPDGLLTALQMLKVMIETKKTLSDLGSCMVRFPQILVNVKVRERKPFEDIPALQQRMDAYHSQLSEDGRILLRYSGTELLARVMVEGRNKQLIESIAHSIADHIREDIGLESQKDAS